MVRFFRVKDVVRLETEAAVTDDKCIGVGPDAGEVSNQTKRALQTRVIGIGLVSAKIRVRESVDVDKINAGPDRKSVFTHDANQREHAPQQESRSSKRSSRPYGPDE
jgi:hypothetical protein